MRIPFLGLIALIILYPLSGCNFVTESEDIPSSYTIVYPMTNISVLRTFSGTNIIGAKYIALTFDDGPGQETKRLLSILDTYHIHATFYVLGVNVIKHPDIIQQIHSGGHEIGTHSWRHQRLTNITGEQIVTDRDRLESIIYTLTDEYPYTYRPPYGVWNPEIQRLMDRPAILWSVDTEDWLYRDKSQNINRSTTGVKDGSIILLHDIYSESVDAVGAIIEQLTRDGYTFVTVSELLYRNHQSLTGTGVCTSGLSCK